MMRGIFLITLMVSVMYFMFSMVPTSNGGTVVPPTTQAISNMLNSFVKTDTITSLDGSSGSGEYSDKVDLAISTSSNQGSATRASTQSIFLDAISLFFNFILIFSGLNILAIFYALSLPTAVYLIVGLPLFCLYIMGLYQMGRTGFIPQ